MMDSVYGESVFETMVTSDAAPCEATNLPSPSTMAWVAAAATPVLALILVVCAAGVLLFWPAAPLWAYVKMRRKLATREVQA